MDPSAVPRWKCVYLSPIENSVERRRASLLAVVSAVFATSCTSVDDDDNAEDLTWRFIATYEHAGPSRLLLKNVSPRSPSPSRSRRDDEQPHSDPEDVQGFGKCLGEFKSLQPSSTFARLTANGQPTSCATCMVRTKCLSNTLSVPVRSTALVPRVGNPPGSEPLAPSWPGVIAIRNANTRTRQRPQGALAPISQSTTVLA